MSTLLEVKDLSVHFPLRKGLVWPRQVGVVRAVDGVSFSIEKGETLGLVGESGCGKSTTGRAILQLVEPTAGSIRLGDEELTRFWLKGKLSGEMRPLRKRLQMIFQDPYASLNPRMTVEALVGEPLVNFGMAKGDALRARVQELLAQVGLDPSYIRRYPHEFSGGQRQRIGIARALALSPELIVCDEPISALDVSIQAQVLNLLRDLQKTLGLTYLFIAHDLAAVRHVSARVAVMYLGRIVEWADSKSLYAAPLHPYTQALLAAAPVPDPVRERNTPRPLLLGEVPSPMNPPSGCAFHPRCPLATARCSAEVPVLRELSPGHVVACHEAKAPGALAGESNGRLLRSTSSANVPSR